MVKKLLKVVQWLVILLAAVAFVFPLAFVLLNAFRDNIDIIRNPLSFSGGLSFDNFVEAFERMNFMQSLVNSLIVTVSSVAIITVFGSMIAFYIARFESKFTKGIYIIFVLSMTVPFQAIMIPFVSIYGNLNMLNSRGALVFFYLGFAMAMTTFLYHGFIKKLSISLEESAMLDGASTFKVFWLVIFPQLKPITSTVMVLNVIWFWNDYLLPSLVLFQDSRTIPLSTFSFFGTHTSNFGLAMAGLVLTLIPVVIFYLFAQKGIVKGITDGAVK